MKKPRFLLKSAGSGRSSGCPLNGDPRVQEVRVPGTSVCMCTYAVSCCWALTSSSERFDCTVAQGHTALSFQADPVLMPEYAATSIAWPIVANHASGAVQTVQNVDIFVNRQVSTQSPDSLDLGKYW